MTKENAVLQGTPKGGGTVYYTGRTGDGWVSSDVKEAFRYTYERAQHQAKHLNRMTVLHGIHFAAVQPDEPFTVTDLETNEEHGEYATLDEARGCVAFDKLKAYSIWQGDRRVEHCELYRTDDDRARQGLGLPNASEGGRP